jgi:hypothetical protein
VDGISGGGDGFLLPGVVGPVRERQPAPNSAPRPPAGPVAGAAFPVAMHRSKSKVQCYVHMNTQLAVSAGILIQAP